MVRPAALGPNPETAASNAFQQGPSALPASLQAAAAAEFDAAVARLTAAGVEVLVYDDTPQPAKPDAVFPNNWVSIHEDGTIVLYPMLSALRRHERRGDIVDDLSRRFQIHRTIDLTPYEANGRFLEGTGSIVFDHNERIAYACISPRTDTGILQELCSSLGYRPHAFTASDRAGMAIYHTNVMMCVAERFAVVCRDCIADEGDRQALTHSLAESRHEIIEVTMEQMYSFAGNMLSLTTQTGGELLAMSRQAYSSLTREQVAKLEEYCELLPLAVETIESAGGGSVRCMICEIFAEPR
jgi:hypothetical protein